MENKKRVCTLRDKLITAVEENLNKNVSAKQIGEIIDMIKDLSECEKNMYEAEYYKDKLGENDTGSSGVNFSEIVR